MSIPVNFNNQQVVEPGVYAMITSGEPARPATFPFGNIAIIDTGNYTGWGGGSGINGQLKSGKEAIYTFENPNDFRAFVKGGELFAFSPYLFNPAEGSGGPAAVTLIKAATTVPAEITRGFQYGQVRLLAKNEGRVGNAVMNEKRAKAVIQFNPTSMIVDNTIILTFRNLTNTTTLQTVNITIDSTLVIEQMNRIAEALNEGSAGLTAKVYSNRMEIFAPAGFGLSANTGFSGVNTGLSISSTGTTTPIQGSATSFLGGADGVVLLKGYGMKFRAGDENPAKFIVELYLGTYAGKTELGFNYGETDEFNSPPLRIASSQEIGTLDELFFWLKNDNSVQQSFVLDEEFSYSGYFNAPIMSSDINSSNAFTKATGGTEVYNPADLDAALEYLREFQNTFFLCDKFGDDARSVQNEKIKASVLTASTFQRYLIIGLGKDETKFDGDDTCSIQVARYFNSERVIGVHSGATLKDPISGIEEKFSSLLTAFNVAGRIGGQEPQEPVTYKTLRLQSYNHIPSVNQRTKALQAGVLHIRDVDGIGKVVHQGINTLQRNTVLFNPDGSSYEISIESIKAQLNKELILNLRPLFVGVNRSRVTAADVKTAVEAYLHTQTSTESDDKLIVKFKNVTVTRVQDYYNVSYGFEPNGPINKLFLTGFMYDTNL